MSSAPNVAEVGAAISSLRVGFQADGADLSVEAATRERVVIRLVLTDETCADCVVPSQVLERIISATLHERFPAITEVRLIDPRA
jgi:hypothetical protein